MARRADYWKPTPIPKIMVASTLTSSYSTWLHCRCRDQIKRPVLELHWPLGPLEPRRRLVILWARVPLFLPVDLAGPSQQVLVLESLLRF
jgi:hypothetical protein